MAQAAPKRSEDVAKASSEGFHGSFCWNELMTSDIEGAKRFYRETIGWSFEPMKMPIGVPIGSPSRATRLSAVCSS